MGCIGRAGAKDKSRQQTLFWSGQFDGSGSNRQHHVEGQNGKIFVRRHA